VGFFAASWTRYLSNVADADPVQVPLSLLFFELSGGPQEALQLHVNDTGALALQGFPETG
jgi:hypothetical protein